MADQRCDAGIQVDDWLTRNGRTQAWLAEQLSVKPSQLWRWMAGQRVPRIEAATQIQNITGVLATSWGRSKTEAA